MMPVLLAPSQAPEESSFQGETPLTTNNKSSRTDLHSTRKTRKKAQKNKECGQCDSSDEEKRSYNEEIHTQPPGAYCITGPQAENHGTDLIEANDVTNETTINASSLADGDVKDRAMLVEADLAPELTSAEEVNIQEEEEIIMKKIQYKRVLWCAMVFCGFAIIANIGGFVVLFVHPPPAFGTFYGPLRNGLAEAAGFSFIATTVIWIPFMGRCCFRSSDIRLEKYAPDDKPLLREAMIVSLASLCLFSFVAIPIIVCLPNFQGLGYAFMPWFFAGTVC